MKAAGDSDSSLLRLNNPTQTVDLSELRQKAEEKVDSYDETNDSDLRRGEEQHVKVGASEWQWPAFLLFCSDCPHPCTIIHPQDEVKDAIFSKGQSRRIYNELFKVIDASDVIIQVLDARDPQGTRSRYIEQYMKREKAYKHLIFVLNKCDLIPTWATVRFLLPASPVFWLEAARPLLTSLFFCCCPTVPLCNLRAAGAMGGHPLPGVSDHGLPRQHDQPLWPGCPHPAPPPVWQGMAAGWSIQIPHYLSNNIQPSTESRIKP